MKIDDYNHEREFEVGIFRRYIYEKIYQGLLIDGLEYYPKQIEKFSEEETKKKLISEKNDRYKFSSTEKILSIYENVKEQTAIYGMSFSVYRFGIIPLFLQLGKTLNIENQFILYETGKYLTYILGLLSTGLFFTTKSSLIRFGLAAMICVLVPQQAFVYNGIYIFPLLIMLLSANSKLSSIETCLTLFLFIWILLPVQLNKFTPKINNISMILMWVLFISIAIRQYLLNKKNNLNSSSKER